MAESKELYGVIVSTSKNFKPTIIECIVSFNTLEEAEAFCVERRKIVSYDLEMALDKDDTEDKGNYHFNTVKLKELGKN